uniref:Peptidase A2 domain-containing protein n=1 Tax=Amphimedon queenslandica TaxID=400682 RepID=A0A1X7VRF8_AMPQE
MRPVTIVTRKDTVSQQCFYRRDAPKREMSDVSEQNLNSLFLDTLISKSNGMTWQATIQLEEKQIALKVDTGTEATAISQDTFKGFNNKSIVLIPSQKSLIGPAGQLLPVLAHFLGKLSYKNYNSRQNIYYVKSLRANLLGLPAITLKLASLNIYMIGEDCDLRNTIHYNFPTLFKGLGNLGEPYTIKLQSDAKEDSLFTARKIPLPLRDMVREELNSMDQWE